MLPNAFIGKKTKPTDAELSAALGQSSATWNELLAELADSEGIDEQEWSSYSLKAGWSLKVKKGARTILYLSPGKGWFRASFALGDKAAKAAMKAGPDRLIKLVKQAPRYAEGAGVRIEVKSAKDLPLVITLARCKAAS
jgi:hypothetical protein